jgi:predicted Zn-dependent protease
LLRKSGQPQQRLRVLEAAVADCPSSPELKNDLAWLLSTSPNPELRDGQRALKLAEGAVAASPENVGFLDTLAAAYAETNDFERAARVAAEVLALLEARGAPEATLVVFREHLLALREGRPIRED